MIKQVEYTDYLEAFLKQLPKGVFMTVKNENEVNTMVIGWANIGVLWGRKVMIVYVRGSRYTHQFLQKTNEFTLSVPLAKDLSKELHFCGVNSGREWNKFSECNLTPVEGITVSTPIIAECDLHYECKIIHKQEVHPVCEQINHRYYQSKDYHIAYFGEIVNCYRYTKD